MAKALSKKFYHQKTLKVARQLLGKFLCRRIGKRVICGLICETEAYCGPNDLASHASRGRTPRTEIMFGPGGRAYIYLIYGMYYCFNIVTEKNDYPAAVLIRGVKIKDIDFKKTNGPGKVCKILHIDKKLNNLNICKKEKLWIEDRGVIITSSQIKKGPRIGIDYAGHYKNKLWRFYIE